jgi:hypothetical protein
MNRCDRTVSTHASYVLPLPGTEGFKGAAQQLYAKRSSNVVSHQVQHRSAARQDVIMYKRMLWRRIDASCVALVEPTRRLPGILGIRSHYRQCRPGRDT